MLDIANRSYVLINQGLFIFLLYINQQSVFKQLMIFE